jgi:diaminohydroxyphosphoribosylaminopyrimidine deaminase / 5-amino-6-(5-phosphoribosylamino)uracil reductase
VSKPSMQARAYQDFEPEIMSPEGVSEIEESWTSVFEADARYLSRAVEIASQARGRTSPNPCVGAVVVKDGQTLGEGAHLGPGLAHAERVALDACTESPKGATMYVSLEPCSHKGRTPPCTDAIIEAGIARTVVASDDPTEKAAGRGLARLREQGIAVEVCEGSVAALARQLNQPFRKHAKTSLPFVICKFAATLDGKVATRTGQSQWISGPKSRDRAHRWRADCDAVCCGIGTVLADDPKLTARIEGEFVPPHRVVFDSHARIPLASRLLENLSVAPVWVVVSELASDAKLQQLQRRGVRVIVASGSSEAQRVLSALYELGRQNVQSVLLEGGPHLAGAFFDAGQIDEVRVSVAPVVFGGAAARTPIEGEGIGSIRCVASAQTTSVEQVGDDIEICSRFADW